MNPSENVSRSPRSRSPRSDIPDDVSLCGRSIRSQAVSVASSCSWLAPLLQITCPTKPHFQGMYKRGLDSQQRPRYRALDKGPNMVEEKIGKYFGYLPRCEGNFRTTTLKN